jgi:hypothetical protein
MARDPQVDMIFSHFIPRYVATGVDPNDLNALMKRIDHWNDWCRLWSEEGSRHEGLANEATARGRRVTAAEANLRAALCYHYGSPPTRQTSFAPLTRRCCVATPPPRPISTHPWNG